MIQKVVLKFSSYGFTQKFCICGVLPWGQQLPIFRLAWYRSAISFPGAPQEAQLQGFPMDVASTPETFWGIEGKMWSLNDHQIPMIIRSSNPIVYTSYIVIFNVYVIYIFCIFFTSMGLSSNHIYTGLPVYHPSKFGRYPPDFHCATRCLEPFSLLRKMVISALIRSPTYRRCLTCGPSEASLLVN